MKRNPIIAAMCRPAQPLKQNGASGAVLKEWETFSVGWAAIPEGRHIRSVTAARAFNSPASSGTTQLLLERAGGVQGIG